MAGYYDTASWGKIRPLKSSTISDIYRVVILLNMHTGGFYTQKKIALWKDAAKKIITVDNYCWNPLGFSPNAHFDFTGRILWYLIKNGEVELVHMSKDDFFKNYQAEPPSLVFIDADHSYEATLADIKAAQRIGARIICGHDYCDLFPGVMRAVDESGGPAKLCGSVWSL